MRAVVRALPGLGGLGSLAYGLWLWHHWVAFVVVGVVVLADAAWSRSQATHPSPAGGERS